MKKGLTQMVFIIDMSGSMYGVATDTIGGFNSMIKDQLNEPGEAKVTTVLFDDRYIILHDGINIKEVKEMTYKEYSPLGATAMLDAVGKTINRVGQQLSALPEDERPEKVMVTIITDGYENASMEYTWDSVKKMINHQREKYSWIFSFLGANIDTMEVSGNLGIDRKLSKSFISNGIGTQSAFSATSKSMSFARGVDVSLMNCTATLDSMSDILDEAEKVE